MGKRELTVLKNITLNIEQGEMVAIMGTSGSGSRNPRRPVRLFSNINCILRLLSVAQDDPEPVEWVIF